MDNKVIPPSVIEIVILSGIAIMLLTLSGALFAYRWVKRSIAGRKFANESTVLIENF